MVEDMIGINVIPGVRGLDLEPLRGLEKVLGLTHGLRAYGVHAISMGMHVCRLFFNEGYSCPFALARGL